MSWYILWKCMKYNEYGKGYALYLLLQCHTDERHSNHFSFTTFTSDNPFLVKEAQVFGCQQSECVSGHGDFLNFHFVVLLYT